MQSFFMYSGIIAWIILLAIGAGYLRHKLTEDREIYNTAKGQDIESDRQEV